MTISGQLARVLLQSVGVVILARLLAPSDYGLVAMVLVIIGIGEVVRDFGLSTAAVQAKTLSIEERTNLFWINSGIGLTLTVALMLGSPLVAALFGDSRLVGLTLVLAVTFLFNGIATQLRADMNRDLSFGRLVVSDILGQLFGLATGVVMALSGFGYWSLAGQQVVLSLSTLTVVCVFARWRPGRYRRDVSVRRFLKFGLEVIGAQALGYASKNIDTLVIGTTLGATPLGYYNRAYQLLALPLSQINAPSTRVALPVLSKLQTQRDRFGAYLLAGQTAMLHLVLTIFSLTAAVAVPLVDLVLGDKWASVAPLFQILAVAGVFQTAGYATYWTFLAKGLTRSQLYWQLASRPIVIGAVIIGSFWGMTGVATSYAGASVVTWFLGLLWIRRVSDVPVRGMFFNVVRAVSGYGVCAAAAWGASLLARDHVPSLLLGIAGWLVAWALVTLAWPGFRRDVSTVVRMGKLLRRSKNVDVVPEVESEVGVSAEGEPLPRSSAAAVES